MQTYPYPILGLIVIVILGAILPKATQASNHYDMNAQFSATIEEIPLAIQEQMRNYTWHPGCPVFLDELAYIQLTHWGFDDQIHHGSLIVNKSLAQEVVTIFKALFETHFLIEKMKPMYQYQGNDELSMADNNTSAFNCRPITGHHRGFSQHSYGRAIDINPRINPYISGNIILPRNARAFVDRSQAYQGKIDHASEAYRIFKSYGWFWGGDWKNRNDYQHFEKR